RHPRRRRVRQRARRGGGAALCGRGRRAGPRAARRRRRRHERAARDRRRPCRAHGLSTPNWYLDEGTHAGAEHLDPAYVASYDAKTGLDLDAALELLRRHGLGPDTTLVDLGCGTGLLAAAAAPEARRVVGVDVSPAMLEVAR